jgi:hypothetical protein
MAKAEAIYLSPPNRENRARCCLPASLPPLDRIDGRVHGLLHGNQGG